MVKFIEYFVLISCPIWVLSCPILSWFCDQIESSPVQLCTDFLINLCPLTWPVQFCADFRQNWSSPAQFKPCPILFWFCDQIESSSIQFHARSEPPTNFCKTRDTTKLNHLTDFVMISIKLNPSDSKSELISQQKKNNQTNRITFYPRSLERYWRLATIVEHDDLWINLLEAKTP